MTLDQAARLLADAGVENPRAEARLLLAHALGVPRAATLSGAVPVSPVQAAVFESLARRRAGREPLAYITGAKEFWSMKFTVGPGVLVPRPETETLIEAALAAIPDRGAPIAIADFGTGSGAILIAALREFPNARGLGLECSPPALTCARANLAAHGLAERGEMRLADWKDAPAAAFDLVFCNPPYIESVGIESLAPEVRLYEPHGALDGGADGLEAYRALAGLLPRTLKPGGLAVLELGMGQAGLVEPMFGTMAVVEVAADLAGIGRALVLRAPK